MKKKKSWYRVVAPTQWYPKIGEEIEGTYIGKEKRTGQFGITTSTWSKSVAATSSSSRVWS